MSFLFHLRVGCTATCLIGVAISTARGHSPLETSIRGIAHEDSAEFVFTAGMDAGAVLLKDQPREAFQNRPVGPGFALSKDFAAQLLEISVDGSVLLPNKVEVRTDGLEFNFLFEFSRPSGGTMMLRANYLKQLPSSLKSSFLLTDENGNILATRSVTRQDGAFEVALPVSSPENVPALATFPADETIQKHFSPRVPSAPPRASLFAWLGPFMIAAVAIGFAAVWIVKRKRRLNAGVAAVLGFFLLTASTAHAQRQMEKLGRGVVAMRKSSSLVYVSWRLLATDPANIGFNVYRSANGAAAAQINSQLITNTTDYVDSAATLTVSNAWFIQPVISGATQALSAPYGLVASAPTRQYFSVPLQSVAGGLAPPYDTKFCWVGDLDGDGEYDFVVDRLSTTTATNQYLQAYKRDGTFLWQMDMGYNSTNQYAIEPGASAISIGDKDNVTVYDLDGDGRAEVIVRTARGVVFADSSTVTTNNDTAQFISVLDGLTGSERARIALPNPSFADGPLNCHLGIIYCDGVHPSILVDGANRIGSGAFNYITAAFDFKSGQLSQRWSWTPPGGANYARGHQIRIADVNHDGKDDLIQVGSVNDGADGLPLFNTELVHGDRFHTTDIDPDRPGLETYSIQQDNPTLLATALYDAATGSPIKKWYSAGIADVGRGDALDMDSRYKGVEVFSTQSGIFDAKGNQINAIQPFPTLGIWWDADLRREMFSAADGNGYNPVINKWNTNTSNADRLYSIYNEGVHTAFGGRPAFFGDIMGDWREEFVVVADDYSEIRIYTTTNSATSRLYCLMQNPEYRGQCTCKGYYQASYPDYYLGEQMSPPAPSPMSDAQLVWRGDGTNSWDTSTVNWFTNNLWISNTTSVAFTSGQSVLFDLTGSNNSAINLSGALSPDKVTVHAPKDYIFGGSGSLTGAMQLIKAGSGKLTLTGTNTYTGNTLVAEGPLVVNGGLPSSPVTVRGGVWFDGAISGTGVLGNGITLEYGGAISPGGGTNSPGTLTISNSLVETGGAFNHLDLSDDPTGVTKTNDRITVFGNLSLSGTNSIVVTPINGTVAPGIYTLITYSGTLGGGLSNLVVGGLPGIPVALTNPPGQIALVVKSYRLAGTITWTGGSGANAWDVLATSNWLNGVAKDQFAPYDNVRFDNTGATNQTVNLVTLLNAGSVLVDSASNYTFNGNGAIVGSGGLTKTNSGTLTINVNSNSYTGRTIIGGGTLAVTNLDVAGHPSSIGAANASPTNLVMIGATLRHTGYGSFTDRGVTLSSGTNTIDTSTISGVTTIAGQLVGTGALLKAGAGQLNLNASNTFSGNTIVKAGVLELGTQIANQYGLGSSTVIFDGGTLAMLNTTGSDYDSLFFTGNWNMVCNTTGRLNVAGRCSLGGTLTGAGTLTVWIPFVRADFSGNWSAFTGQINVITDADGSNFRCNNSSGYSNARINLGTDISLQNRLGGTPTISIGELSGAAGCNASASGGNDGLAVNWSVGGLNTSATFAGNTYNGIGFIKVGTGTWTWSGTNIAHTGQTTVTGGALLINGNAASASGAVTVGVSGMLGGTGTIGGATTINGKISPGTSIGTLTINNNVTLNSGSTTFIEINRTAGTKDLLDCNATLTYGGTLQVTNLSGTLTNGDSFKIFDAGAYSNSFSAFILPALATNLSWNTANLTIDGTLSIGGGTNAPPTNSPTVLVWKGDGSANAWDLNSTTNWLDTNNAAKVFVDYSPVTFNDVGSNNVAVALTGTLQPASVTVNGSKNYTFGGTGTLAGTNALVKAGPGQLTISVSNAFAGGTIISNGTIVLGSPTANSVGLGSGTITFRGGTLEFNGYSGSSTPDYGGNTNELIVPAGETGTIHVSQRFLSPGLNGTLAGSGTLELLVNYVRGDISGNWSNFFGQINVRNTGSDVDDFRIVNTNGFANAKLYLGSNILMYSRTTAGAVIPIGEFSADGTAAVSAGFGSSLGTQSAVTWRVGKLNTDATNAALIQGTTTLVKEGSGKWTLAGSNTYSGTTTVSAGTLLVNGNQSSAAGAVTVLSGATLGGSGVVGGAVTIQSGGRLSPGTSIGTLALTNSLTLAAGCTNIFEISHSPLTNDVIVKTGMLSYGGALLVTNISGTLTAGDSFKLFDAASYSSSFSSLNLPPLAVGLAWNVNTLNTDGTIRVSSINTNPPVFESILRNSADIVLAGSNGMAGASYYVLTSTNLNLAVAQWTRIATNQFDSSGKFLFINTMDPTAPMQKYFMLQLLP